LHRPESPTVGNGVAEGKPNALVAEDRDNGLVLHLHIDRDRYGVGDTIVATATLENTLPHSITVHYLNIAPMYVMATAQATLSKSSEFLRDWRYSYCSPLVLDPAPISLPDGTLLSMLPTGDIHTTKENYKYYLGDARYSGSSYPTFAVPALSRVTRTCSFEASTAMNYVDVGLFSLKTFYSEKVLSESARSEAPLLDSETVFRPQIWFGCLYVGLDVKVE
jgi:hypothetical protein